MKILVLTFYFKPDLCAGSFRSSAFIDQLKKKISKKDKIDVITTMPNRYYSYSKKALSVERKGTLTIYRVKLPSHKSNFVDQAYAFTFFFFSALKIILRNEYDLIFATSSRLFTAFLGAIAAKLKKAVLYLDIRDIFTDTLKSVFKKKSIVFLPFFYLVEKYTILSAKKVNIVSKGFKEYFSSLNNKISYSFFTNGIDDEFIDASFRKTKHSNKKIIVYAGNIGQGQGLEKIIPSIAKKKNDFEFWIIGDGGTKTILNERLKTEHINNVMLLPPVNRKELIDIYRESDYLFLHLNDYPAFEKVLPSKIFEYAATGKPVFAGVGGYAKQFISENFDNFMLFKPCSAKDFFIKLSEFSIMQNNDTRSISKFFRSEIMDDMADDFLKSID